MQHYLPCDTPWGAPQSSKLLATGIVAFTTSTHGGIWLDAERNALIPLELKQKTFQLNGFHGWYEQDCDAQIVINFFGLSLDSDVG